MPLVFLCVIFLEIELNLSFGLLFHFDCITYFVLVLDDGILFILALLCV